MGSSPSISLARVLSWVCTCLERGCHATGYVYAHCRRTEPISRDEAPVPTSSPELHVFPSLNVGRSGRRPPCHAFWRRELSTCFRCLSIIRGLDHQCSSSFSIKQLRAGQPPHNNHCVWTTSLPPRDAQGSQGSFVSPVPSATPFHSLLGLYREPLSETY